MIDVESSTGTSPAPVIASGLGRVPASMTTTGALPRPAVRQGDLDRLRPRETGLAFDQVKPVLRQAARVILPRAGDHEPFPLAHRGHVHRYRTNAHAVLRGAARLVGKARASDHRLGRGATRVDTCAAELVALDERHLLASLRQFDGKEPAALAGPDHDCVVVLIGHYVFSWLLMMIGPFRFRHAGYIRKSDDRVVPLQRRPARERRSVAQPTSTPATETNFRDSTHTSTLH
jgi:hypothetical protein